MGNAQDPNEASNSISLHFLQASWDQVPYGGANNYILTMTLKNLLVRLSTQRQFRAVRDILGCLPASSYQFRGTWVSHWPCPYLSLVQMFQIPSCIVNGAPHPCGPPSAGSPEEEPPYSDWFGFPQFTQNLPSEGCCSHYSGPISQSCPSQMQRTCAEVRLGQLVSDPAILGLSPDSHH